MDIISVFRRTSERQADRPFAFDSRTTVTYGEADVRSDAVGAALCARGITDGEPLGLCAPDSVDLLLTIIGAWKAGALPSLIDPRTSETDLPYFVGDVDSKLVVCTPELRDCLARSGAGETVDLADLATSREVRPAPDRHHADAPLYLSYTSGTTGMPKGAILRSGPVTLGTACIAERLGLSRHDVLLATTPTSSSFQLVAALMPAIHVGASLLLVAGLRAEQFMSVATERGANVLVAYPLTLSDVVNLDIDGSFPFKLALSGGSPLAPRIKRNYRDRLGIPLVESYGQSELGGFMALGHLSVDERSLSGFVGKPLPDRPSIIWDQRGAEVPAGDWGEVVVPCGYFAGYKNKEEATSEALGGGVLHTGDLGVVDDDGYLKVLGRTREQADALRRGGFLRDAEDVYYEHPDVKHATVVSGQQGRIEAFVELLPERAVTGDEVAEFAASSIPASLRPSKTTLLDVMPRSFSGKADRRRLEQEVVG
jgi:acyl-CoA synthetase (AMP-forming)/AMP-acid ligase II